MKDTGDKGWTSLKTAEPMAQLAAVIAAEANASGHGLSTEGVQRGLIQAGHWHAISLRQVLESPLHWRQWKGGNKAVGG